MGQPLAISQGSTIAAEPDLSPDGRWLTSTRHNGKWENIFVSENNGNGLRQLTDGVYVDRSPRWSPDGRRIAFYSNRSVTWQVWAIHPDGSGLEQLTHEPRGNVLCPVWSPDGSRLAYSIMDVNSFVINIGKALDAQSPQPLPIPSGLGLYFMVTDWSHDGGTLAGVVHELAGPAGIGIYSLGQRSFERLTDRGDFPRWLSDGRRLLFECAGKLYLVNSRSKKVHEVPCVTPYEVLIAGECRLDSGLDRSDRHSVGL